MPRDKLWLASCMVLGPPKMLGAVDPKDHLIDHNLDLLIPNPNLNCLSSFHLSEVSVNLRNTNLLQADPHTTHPPLDMVYHRDLS